MKQARQRKLQLVAAALLVTLPLSIAVAAAAGMEARDITWQPAATHAVEGEMTPIDEIGMQFYLNHALNPVPADEEGITVGNYATQDAETSLRVMRMPAVTGTGEPIRNLSDLARMYQELGMEDVQQVRINSVPALVYTLVRPSTVGIVFLKGRTLVEFVLSSLDGEMATSDYAALLVQSISPLPSRQPAAPAQVSTPGNLP